MQTRVRFAAPADVAWVRSLNFAAFIDLHARRFGSCHLKVVAGALPAFLARDGGGSCAAKVRGKSVLSWAEFLAARPGDEERFKISLTG